MINELKETQQLTAILVISTVSVNLDRAKVLLRLAAANPTEADCLAASSIILMAAALEQCTRTKLAELSAFQAMEDGINVSCTNAGQLLGESLRHRMISLPRLLSRHTLEFNSSCLEARRLFDLIRLRNNLAHLDESPHVIQGPLEDFLTDEDKLQFKVPMPSDIWGSVNESTAWNYLRAVELYMQEVFEPEQIVSGVLVRRAR